MRRTSTALQCCLLALTCACGEAGDPAPVHGPDGPHGAPAAASATREPAELAGRLVVAGLPGGELRGAVQLSLWNASELGRASALPLLARSYDLRDPDWSRTADVRSRYFGLDDTLRVGDPGRGLSEGLVLEARLCIEDESGARVSTCSATLAVRNGETDLQLVLPTTTATAQPGPLRQPGGR